MTGDPIAAPARRGGPMRSVRVRLMILAILPLAVLMPVLLGVAMLRWIDKFDQLLIAKVASDLRVAEQYMDRLKATQAAEITALGQSVDFAAARDAGDAALSALLKQRQTAMGLDFLIYDPEGGGALPASTAPVIEASRKGAARAGLAVLSGADLRHLGPAMAGRARLPLVPTEAARQIDRQVESRGMMLLAAYQPGAAGGGC